MDGDQRRRTQYEKQIVVGIDAASARGWKKARHFFSQLPQKPTLLWNDGLRMQKVYKKLEDAELSAGPGGKVRNVWTCFGYVLASEQARMVAVHDCDSNSASPSHEPWRTNQASFLLTSRPQLWTATVDAR